MDEQLTLQCLKEISDASQKIGHAAAQIQTIIGIVLGSTVSNYRQKQQDPHTAATEQPLLLTQSGNEFGTQNLLKEIKEMIIELNIQGSIRERSNGLIEFRNNIFGSVYGRTKEAIKKQLEQKLKEIKTKKLKSEPKKQSVPLLSNFYEREYLPYKKSSVKVRTITEIEKYMKQILSNGFDKPLNLIKTEEIEKYLLSIPKTRKRQVMRGVFNNLFTYAKQLGRIKQNPCDNVTHVQHKQKLGRALSFKEQCAFFDALFSLPQSRLNIMKTIFIIFVYLTGARRQEAIDITVENIDFENNTILIDGTKSDGSHREIPLSPLAKKALCHMLLKKGKVFPITLDQVIYTIKRINNKIHLHALRHTYGTIAMCVRKLDPKTVSLYMGHATLEMTLERYTHPEQLDKALFFDGSISDDKKLEILKNQYDEILEKIERYLG